MSEDVFGIVGTVQAGIFRVEQVVAEGGFAVVYRAHHEGFRAKVALKCLKVPDAMSEAQRAAFLEKFREEGELLFRLSAIVPAVVRPLHVDVLVLGPQIVPFLALEWLDGEGLDHIIEKRRAQGKAPLDIKRLVAFLQPAAQALSQAHQVPGPEGPIVIVHRDIKPDNIFVAKAPEGEVVKILDFGIARTKSSAQLDAGEVTSSGALDAFTPGYAAPEQWLPQQYGQAGPWTDVFGLAATMIEALTGRGPFVAADLATIAERTNDPSRRPTPRAMGVSVPDAVERAFRSALAVDPRERTRSIAAFWTELETALGMPASIKMTETRAPARSLTGTSDPPPPMGGSKMAPTMMVPVGSHPAPDGRERSMSPGRIRKPEGELRPARAALLDAPAIPMELELGSTGPVAATPPPSPPEPPPPAPRPRDPPPPPQSAPRAVPIPIQLSAGPPRPRGTMAAPSRGERALADLGERLRGPIALVIVAIVLTVADQIYTRVTGDLFAVAGLRPIWVTAPLALIGVGLASWRLLDAF